MSMQIDFLRELSREGKSRVLRGFGILQAKRFDANEAEHRVTIGTR